MTPGDIFLGKMRFRARERCQPPNLGKIPDTPNKVAGTFFPFSLLDPQSPERLLA